MGAKAKFWTDLHVLGDEMSCHYIRFQKDQRIILEVYRHVPSINCCVLMAS